MSDRIDHAAEARKILDGPARRWPDSADSQVEIASAQVHATLALVEQQRIANVLAAAHLKGDVFEHEKMLDIREALGL